MSNIGQASFRDPSGSLFLLDGRVIRALRASAAQPMAEFLTSELHSDLVGRGALVSSRILDGTEAARLADQAGPGYGAFVEHSRVAFPSYPHEWCPAMLRAAGELTLDIADLSIQHGYGLKDATPFNVLFEGPNPVFVDVASFERRDPLDARWLAYGQFQRAFVLPLVAYAAAGLNPAEVFLANRDGLEPERVYAMLGAFSRLRPRFLMPVTLPTWLARRGRADGPELYEAKRESSAEKSRFVMAMLLRQLRRQLRVVSPVGAGSAWSDYMATSNYEALEFRRKEEFVRCAIGEAPASTLLDVGCNTGHFSALAASLGIRVVALDSDLASIERTFLRASTQRLTILPLFQDLARPTPAVGWNNAEESSFLDRARGFFDVVLMLAVVHHLAVTHRVPLAEIFRLASNLTKDRLIIEYVPASDAQFQRLLRGRGHLYQDWNRENFEQSLAPWFESVRSQEITSTGRRLYLLRKRS